MEQVDDWQSPDFLKIFEIYDRADFAQEFLRRSPVYRAAFASARSAPVGTGAFGALARRWGLVFRRRSRP